MKHLLFFILSILCFGTTKTYAINYEKHGNVITIHITNADKQSAKLIQLEVLGEKIIRVRATPEEQFVKKTSLIVVPQRTKTKYNATETDGNVIVKTSSVQANVNTSTGRIEFFDANGKKLLSEIHKDGKTFKHFYVPEREIGTGTLTEEQRNGWTWHAQFDSPDDEAFYGLGQHQAEELNMKGKNEDLFQYNTKVSIPMVLSNKGYGLLWDSYSFCRFGNPNPYQQLHKAFKLYDKNGKEGSLTGTYVDKIGKVIVRAEDSIYFEHAVPEINPEHSKDLGIDALPKGFNLEGAHVTYQGFIEAPQDCNYHFNLYYAGYMKVFIDNQQVVEERWRTAWNPNAWKFTCKLKKGKRTPIRIEWDPDGGVSYCGLRVAVPQTEEEQNRLSIWSEMSRDMDYYFIAGPTMDEIISGYRTLTGKASVYPKWALGFWQSRERYQSSAQIG